MADNFISNPGSGGSTFAADEISGVLYPRTKLVHGADGVNAGDVSSANPLPVTLASTDVSALATAANQTTLLGYMDGVETLIGITNTALAAIKTAVELIDNTVSGSELQVDLVGALPVGGNFIGNVGLALTSTSGASNYHYISAASTNSQNIKATQGCVTTITAMNVHATDIRYLKIYDSASAPTVGTTIPIQTYALAPLGGGVTVTFPDGMACTNGIGIGITSGIADNSTGAVTGSDVVVNITYR
jgi:hypothetical protein